MRPSKEIKTIKEVTEKSFLQGGSPTCQGCPGELGLKLALKAMGKDTIVVNASGCMTLLCNYPHTPLKVSWIHSAIENAPATATGIIHALRIRKRDMRVLCYVGDGATYDIGFQALSAAMMRESDPLVYVCYNNQLYGNTGAQWAPSTPYLAVTKTTPHGKKIPGNVYRTKNMVKIMAAHGVYAATASAAYPLDYLNKIIKARDMNKPTYIEFLVPCIPGWGIESGKAIEVSRLAVQTGFWPLYEVEEGRVRLNYKPDKLAPIENFLKYQERYRDLTPERIRKIQEYVNKNWEVLLKEEARK